MKKLLKYEPWLFALMVAAGTLPMLISKYFVTLDGPSHLYNAILIKELVTGSHPEISNLFVINPLPLPNWSGHFFMALFSLVFPAWISEKIVLLACITLLPLFFRKLVLHLYPQNQLLTYPIILFAHNSLFYFGFFNMTLGIVFIFMTAYLFVKYLHRIHWINGVIISLLLLVIWFSHIMIFMITLALLVVLLLVMLKGEHTGDKVEFRDLKSLWKRFIMIILASIPAIFLSIIYFIRIDSIEPAESLGLPVLMQWIIDVRPILALAYNDKWTPWTNLLFLSFLVTMTGSVIMWVKAHCRINDGILQIKWPLHLSLMWLLVWFAFLLMFLVLPNAILLSERLIYLFFLFFILWLGSLKVPRGIALAGVVVIMAVHVIFTGLYLKTMPALSKNAIALENAGRKIDKNSLVLTLNYSDNWLHSHITGYLSTANSLAILENYEADLKWFPVQWNPAVYQTEKLYQWGITNRNLTREFYRSPLDTTCFSMPACNQQIVPISYVVVVDSKSPAEDSTRISDLHMLEMHYDKIFSEGFCTVFRRKSY